MPYNFDTHEFEHPPLLDEIFQIDRPDQRVYFFADVIFWKSNRLKLPLTLEEQKFWDTEGLHGEIMSDGWHSPFYQIYSWPQWDGIIEVLKFCGHPKTANSILEARSVFYRGRSDLPSIEARVEAGLDGFHLTDEENERFYDIGDYVTDQLETQCYPDLTKWVECHRDHFTDFPREAKTNAPNKPAMDKPDPAAS